MRYCYRDGRVLPPEDLSLPISDRGFLYGDTIFETIAVHAGAAFDLEAHLARLERGLTLLAYRSPFLMKDAKEAVSALINSLPPGEGHAVLRLTVTRGVGARGLGTATANAPGVIGLLFDAPDLSRKAQAGLPVVTTMQRRPHPDCLPPDVKHGNYLANILAAQKAETAGADEALMLDWKGEGYSCATTGNLFAEIGGALVTPPLSGGALAGTMRRRIFDLAREAGIACREGALTAADLSSASGLFLSNSVRGVAWISRLDAERLDRGPFTTTLEKELRAMIVSECGGSFLPPPPA